MEKNYQKKSLSTTSIKRFKIFFIPG